MATQNIARDNKKDKQILMFVNIAHTLNFIAKKIAKEIFITGTVYYLRVRN